MYEVLIFLYILLVHWWADFVVQTEWQARNKSKSFAALIYHTSSYSVFWLPAMIFICDGNYLGVLWFMLITFVCHTATDYITSRINAKLVVTANKNSNYHNFFVSIGFDQWLHFVQLFLTYHLIFQKS